MSILALILTPWVGNGDGDLPNGAYRPRLGDDYRMNWSDATGQPAANLTPRPNMLAIVAEVDEQTLNAIDRDPDYFILWSKPA